FALQLARRQERDARAAGAFICVAAVSRYSADDDLRTEAALARVGHNHWALRQLELEIRRRSERWADLLAWVEGIVDEYQQAPGSAAWKTAVSEAFALARSVGERLWQPGLLLNEVDIDLKQRQSREGNDQADR